MNVQLQLLQTSAKDAAVAEDAFMTISSLILGKYQASLHHQPRRRSHKIVLHSSVGRELRKVHVAPHGVHLFSSANS